MPPAHKDGAKCHASSVFRVARFISPIFSIEIMMVGGVVQITAYAIGALICMDKSFLAGEMNTSDLRSIKADELRKL